MPYKFNESRRHKIKKALYKVTNWADYNNALRNRGDITIWFTQDAVDNWRPAKTGSRGRPVEYSDHAIEGSVALVVSRRKELLAWLGDQAARL